MMIDSAPASTAQTALANNDAQAILEYPLPEGFLEKLMERENWSKPYAQTVIKEYLRFVYLAVIAPQEVTPSEIVDRVWHLHLTYTRDYWLKLTPLLPQALHHDPASPLAEVIETRFRYQRQYEYTKRIYGTIFGQAPPDDVWGEAPEQEHALDRMVDFAIKWSTLLLIISLFIKFLSPLMQIMLALVLVALLLFDKLRRSTPFFVRCFSASPADQSRASVGSGGGGCGGGGGCCGGGGCG